MSVLVEVIKNRLYWISDVQPPKNQPASYFVCIDNVVFI